MFSTVIVPPEPLEALRQAGLRLEGVTNDTYANKDEMHMTYVWYGELSPDEQWEVFLEAGEANRVLAENPATFTFQQMRTLGHDNDTVAVVFSCDSPKWEQVHEIMRASSKDDNGREWLPHISVGFTSEPSLVESYYDFTNRLLQNTQFTAEMIALQGPGSD